MKQYLIKLLTTVLCITANASQDYKMSFHQKTGENVNYLIQQLDNVSCQSDQQIHVCSLNSDTTSYTSENVDSITFATFDKTPIKILAVGNSFSEDAIEQELYGLLNAIGKPIIIGNMYIAGCDLEKHWTMASSDSAAYSYRKIVDGIRSIQSSVSLLTAIQDEEWDYISFQEGAGHHGFTDYIEPYLTNLINYCRTNAKKKDFKTIYHSPWAAQTGCTSVKFSYYDYDQAKMYNNIVNATKQIVGSHNFDLVINSMDVIQNGRTSYLGDTFNRDGWHLNKSYGRYAVGCLWFEKLTGICAIGNLYHPATISENVAKICQYAAHLACMNPYRISDMSSFVKKDDDLTSNKRILASWYFTPQRAKSDGCIKTWTGQDEVGIVNYSNKAGERGYYLANGSGHGKLSYIQIDKTAWDDTDGDKRAGLSILDAVTGGQPVMCGQMPGDYWLFETTGDYEFEEGSMLHISYAYTPGKYGAKYWILEYLDGDTWVPALETTTTTISASKETITYNIELAANNKVQIDATITLANRTTEFKVRMRCCSEYQVNDKWFEHPRRQSSQRIAGTPSDENMPIMEEIIGSASSKKK